MSKIIVNTQEELNGIALDFNGEIIIVGGDMNSPIDLSNAYLNATVILNGNAVVVMRENSQVKEMWENSQVKEMWGNSQVKEMWGNSQVKEMRENSQVKEMWGNSQVNYMWGNSQVNYMRENSQVNYMRENSQVNYMRGNSQVNYMRENSQVNYMWGNSQVKEMWGNVIIKQILSNQCKINCFGYNYIFVSNEVSDISNINLNETSQIIRFDTFKTKPTVEFYLKNYDIKKKDEQTLLFYKAVHKINDLEFHAHHNPEFNYSIGETKYEKCSTDITNSCDFGLHVSDLRFAIDFGKNWKDFTIIVVEVPIDKIVVSVDCNGKVRTSELTVVRELPLEEYKHLL